MAITAQTFVAHDGVRNVIIQCVGVSDGVTQEVNERKVDVSELSPPANSVKVKEIEWSVSGPGTVVLAWDNNPEPVPFAYLQGAGELDYCHIEGLVNKADAPSGDILLSTLGFEGSSAYTVALHMTKK